jgi:hypothetical protein
MDRGSWSLRAKTKTRISKLAEKNPSPEQEEFRIGYPYFETGVDWKRTTNALVTKDINLSDAAKSELIFH